MDLVGTWLHKTTLNVQDLRSLLLKPLFVAQFFPPARLFTYRMLEILHVCPLQGSIPLSPKFRKDLAWFQRYLPRTNGVFLIHDESRTPISLYVDACTSGCRVVTADQAYHMVPPLPTHTHPPTQLVHLPSRDIKCHGGSQGLGPSLHRAACPPLL